MSVSFDGTAEISFDRYARLVRRMIDVPVGLVTIVEADRQVFLGALGLPEPYQSQRQTPLTHSFCQYVVADGQPLVVADARLDERLQDNRAIVDLRVIAYAGWPLLDARGEVVGSLCAIHDEPHTWSDTELETLADLAAACSAELTQRQLARDLASTVAQLTATTAELERSNQGLADFAGQVSHDLRNPLAGVSGALEMLDDLQAGRIDDVGVYPQSSSAFVLARARRSTSRMADLVHDVLEFAVVGGQLTLTAVDVGALVASVLEDSSADRTGPSVTVGPLVDVVADATQLRVVVQNLLGNAVKHAPGSPIEIPAVVAGDTWILEVVDHGPGIAAEDRERVLASFVRLDSTVPGSGLGLATCARVAHAHDGTIEVCATAGGGTTVRMSIPVGRTGAASLPSPHPPAVQLDPA